MNIIPVIDLMNGHAVHAKLGDRSNYLPIQSRLCASSAPLEIVTALLELYPFSHLYIADINAIQDRGEHSGIIRKIHHAHPQIEIWLDAGMQSLESVATWRQYGVQCIIGSECMADMQHYLSFKNALGNTGLLSLDFKQDIFLGPEKLMQNPTLWPERIIAMTLDKVGSNTGPDMRRLKSLQIKHKKVYAAGGVRNKEDLMDLANSGIAGVLVASALHSGLLTASDIGASSSAVHCM